MIFSNWTKAGFFDLDFRSAVAKSDKATDETATTPSFVNLAGESSGLSPRGSWPILGRDKQGGYWIQGNMRNDLWAGIEQELAELAAVPA